MVPIDEIMKLKTLERAGWVRKGVPDPESVADHSFSTALLAFFFCPPNLDRGKAVSMALLHDLPEARIGDITPHDSVPLEKKASMERKAILEITSDPDALSLFNEFLAQESGEAKFVLQVDKLEMALQAKRYAGQGLLGENGLEEFLDNALEVLRGTPFERLATPD